MAGWLDTVYSRSPTWVQQVGVAAWGVWWYNRRFNKTFHQLVAEFKGRERWSPAQFRALQGELLGTVLAAAWNSPYYREVFGKAGLSPGMDPWDAFARIPILPKDTLRTRGRELLTQDPPPRGTIVLRTSGTTGTPTEIFYSRRFHALELAVPEARNLHWAGLTYRDRRIMFGARKVIRFDQDRPPFWRYSPREDLAYASIYHLSPKTLPAYLDYLKRFRPRVVMGYPSALAVVARFALETNDLPPPAVGVFTTSETLTPNVRELLERAWQCKVFDRYGAVEGCAFASQCAHGRYHLSPEIGIVEVLDREGKPCAPGEIGQLVCTGLQNPLQPLIRYRIGDAARWSTETSCPCGVTLPLMESFEGRFEDICFSPDGRQFLRFDTVFKGVHHLKQAQVVQETLDRFTIRVTVDPGFDEADIAKLKANMRQHVGDVTTEVEVTDLIERTPAGKFRAVVCKLKPEERPTAATAVGAGARA